MSELRWSAGALNGKNEKKTGLIQMQPGRRVPNDTHTHTHTTTTTTTAAASTTTTTTTTSSSSSRSSSSTTTYYYYYVCDISTEVVNYEIQGANRNNLMYVPGSKHVPHTLNVPKHSTLCGILIRMKTL